MSISECVMCRRHSGSGISVRGKFICCECEKKLVNTGVNDDGYDGYKDLIKKNIYGDFILK